MPDRPRGGLAALCIAQTTSWGLLFYSLPAAVAPISQETGWSDTAITGALSAGLLVSAIAGLKVGSVLDSHGPRTVMTLGAVIGVAALALVAWSPNLPLFYLAWLVAGFAQSAVFYPPAFAVITRWYGPRRVGPLMTLTLVAGLSSTVFAPLTAYLIEQFGWRTSYLIMAGILAVVSVPLHAFFLNSTWSGTGSEPTVQQSRTEIRQVTRTRQFLTLQVVMTVATFTLFAVTINLIPLLLERGIDYSTAALAFGLVGAGQVIGRLGYPSLTRRTTPQHRTLVILGSRPDLGTDRSGRRHGRGPRLPHPSPGHRRLRPVGHPKLRRHQRLIQRTDDRRHRTRARVRTPIGQPRRGIPRNGDRHGSPAHHGRSTKCPNVNRS